MKKNLILFFLLLVVLHPVAGQDKNSLNNNELSINFGSYRNDYLFAITDIQFKSAFFGNTNFKASGRLRSYGTLFFISKSAYDFSPQLEYYFTKTIKPVYFSAGIGFDARLRLINDERSEAQSSVEPLVSVSILGNYKKIYWQMPVWTRFYSNGISFTMLPQVSYQFSNRFTFFLRYELSSLSIYKMNTHEWRHDNFLGASFLF